MYRTEWTISEERIDGVNYYVVRYEGDFVQCFHSLTMARFYVVDELSAGKFTIKFEDDGSALVPTVRLVWERNATADYSMEYRLSSGRTIRLVRKGKAFTDEGF